MNNLDLLIQDFKIILKDFFLEEGDDNLINFQRITNTNRRGKILERLYSLYNNKNEEDIHRDSAKIEEITPHIQEYNTKKFWFKDESEVIKVKNGEIIAFKDGIKVILPNGTYLDGGEVDSSELVITEDNPFENFVYVYYPKKINKDKNNFYLKIFGNNLLQNTNQPIIRYYFSLNPEKGVGRIRQFIEHIESYLNERNIPFQLKIPYTLDNFNRNDNCILYIAQNHYFYVKDFIQKELWKKNYGKPDSILRNELPLFVKELYPGVGFAEDPFSSDDSFGMDRCKQIIEAIDLLSQQNKDISIETLVKYLVKNGYKEGFYRNPYTNFNYRFEDNNNIEGDNIVLMSIGKPYHFPYNLVALNYGLELMEKAVWLDNDTFTWFSYDEEGEQKYYKILNEGEILEIFSFLDKLLKIRYNRRRFPKNVIKIIEDKIEKSKENDFVTYKKSLQKLIVESKNKYLNVWSHLDQIELSGISQYVNNTNKIVSNILKDKEKEYEIIGENINKFLDSWDSRNITPKHIHDLNILILTHAKAFKEATKIYYKYAKPNYPIANEFNNYEYWIKGKLQVGTIMLYVYCKTLFD